MLTAVARAASAQGRISPKVSARSEQNRAAASLQRLNPTWRLIQRIPAEVQLLEARQCRQPIGQARETIGAHVKETQVR